jgi:hypothetical protein
MLFVVGVSSLTLEAIALLFPEWMPVISRVMRADGGRWVMWPAILGGLGGHFWSPKWLYFPVLKPVQAWVLIPTALALLAFDFFGPRVSSETAFLIFLGFAFYCAIFWSQCS